MLRGKIAVLLSTKTLQDVPYSHIPARLLAVPMYREERLHLRVKPKN
jgi:hypothetical protein